MNFFFKLGLSLYIFFYCNTIAKVFSHNNSMGLGLDIVQDWQPQQIHLSYGELPEEIVVTWVTINETGESIVNYGIHHFESEATSIPFKFIDGGDERRVIWIHKVHINNLTLGTRYIYRCGSDQGWSEIFSFKAMNEGTDWPIHIALYGDLGVVNPQSLTRLQKETEEGMYDAIIHIGDFAYDMHTDNARMGDSFMKIIEPISAYVPYMVCPGNHEEKYNFSNYRARFSMPFYHENENLFYSWNMGPIHFIAVDTEAYYYLNFGIKPLFSLHNWLLTDLEKATCPEVRAVRPWIILYGHRPMYCSNKNKDDCIHKYNLVRVGLPFMPWLGMEQLLAKYGVDLAIWAHEHSYERLWPVYDYNVLNGSYYQPYTNPKGPVHIITGSAGCLEKTDDFVKKLPYWSAFHSTDYGYTRLFVPNKTHLYLEQVSDDQNGAVIDNVWIVRDRHESYSYLLDEEKNAI